MRAFVVFCVFWTVLLGGGTVLFAQAPVGADEALEAAKPSQMDLLDDRRPMRVGDYLVYQVIEEREPATVLFVNDQGMVDIPLLGEVEALGKTCRALAFVLKTSLEESFFYEATVLVRFRDATTSRGRYTLSGRVARPGRKEIPADEVLTASMAVMAAGGALSGADLSQVAILRGGSEGGEEERITVNVEDVLENGNVAADVVIRPGDILVVPESESAGGRYIVTGMVGSPGVFQLPTDGTKLMLNEAILKAGGFQQWARKDRVEVIRKDPNDENEQIRLQVDVEAILQGRKIDSNVEVKVGDIIHVSEKWFSM